MLSTTWKIIIFFFVLVLVKIFIVYYVTNDTFAKSYPPVIKSHTNVDAVYIGEKLKKFSELISESVMDKSLSEKLIKQLDNMRIVINSIKKWHQLPDRFERINENIIYKNFDIMKPKRREKLNIILIVSSAPARLERRMAIRETWWPDCKSNSRVTIKCIFLTDRKKADTAIGKDLLHEKETYGDVFFQDLTGGHDFGKRFLYHLVWAKQNYDFDYFLRLDDDYFVCMDRFVLEVPMPPLKQYHWGWVHCQENIVRPEESIIMFSVDIVDAFLSQDPDEMMCHRWADQMIGVWNEMLKLPKFYHHDTRLHHDPPAQFVESFKTEQNICTKYIGVHGAYPVQMRTLWKNRGPKNYTQGKTFNDYAPHCHLPSVMLWQNFGKQWIAEPKLCKDNPDWGGSHGTTYIGRQGQ